MVKLHLAETDYNDLHNTVAKRRKGSKRVDVEAQMLFDLLRDYAALYAEIFPNNAPSPRRRSADEGLV